MASTSQYGLKINLLGDISTFVEKGKYAPIVEILPHTTALVLPPGEDNEWVEINGRSKTDFPVLTDSKSAGPPIVHADDEKVSPNFDLKFSAPDPEQKNLWFAVKTDPVKDGTSEADGADGALKIDFPAHFDVGLVGKTLSVNKFGHLKLSVAGDKLQASLPTMDDRVGLVLDTKTTLLFWILDSKVTTPPDITQPEQTIEMLPGLARIQLPSQAGEGLQVKVWLEAQDTTDLVKYQDQSHKILVRYQDDKELKQLHLNELGLWHEDVVAVNEDPVQNGISPPKANPISEQLDKGGKAE